MTSTYYDKDVDPKRLQDRKVAIVGYGSQGHAHALNLSDSGVSVRVGLHAQSDSRTAARAENLVVGSVAEVASWADTVVLLTPDPIQPRIFEESIRDHLRPGDTLMFGHGFNIRYETIQPPPSVDVSMVAPKAPGHRVRETYLSGEGTPALVAVEQDASGEALQNALAYAYALGCTRAGVIRTTFQEETETDLFGEQAVLCGGVSALIKAAFETLVEAGYQPEVAYFECLHELKLIVDLIYQGGLNYMRYSISDTAEYGDYTAGEQIIDEAVRERMRELLARVQDGTFARQWIAEFESGQKNFLERREAEQTHSIEAVGARLRQRMSFLDSVQIPAKAR